MGQTVRNPWFLIEYFGDAPLMFPLAGIVALRLAYLGLWRQALYWCLSLGLGAAVILTGKLAFAFGGWFVPSVNIYSISGHAMLTASVYPVLLTVLGSAWGTRTARFGLFAGICLALLGAVALIAGRYHTPAETLIGMIVGLTVTWINLHPPRWLSHVHPPRWLPHVRPTPIFARLMICGLLMMVVPASIKPLKVRFLYSGLNWLGVTEHYSRSIDFDPISGRTVVTVKQCRLPFYKDCSSTF